VRHTLLVLALTAAACGPKSTSKTTTPELAKPADDGPVSKEQVAAAKQQLLAKYPSEKARIERGVHQVASLWRTSDGDLAAFCVEQFAPDQPARDALFDRLQTLLEQLDGHNLEVGRAMRWATEVESGPILPVDPLTAAYDPGAHVTEDLFATKVAFAALLNFPLTTLDDRLRDGPKYSRREWAEVRLTGRFDTRIPGEITAEYSAAAAASDQYIASYNIWMHHVLDEQGQRRWAKGKRLISHWNLRDELKANYADADALAKQRTIVQVMQRIVTQTIPRAVIDNPHLDWNPFTNEVTAAPKAEIEEDAPKDRPAAPSDAREEDRRFGHVLALFHAHRRADPYAPTAPSALARAFDDAEIPEARMRELLTNILSSPLVGEAAKEIEKALGRKLEPQDLWYEFGGGAVPEAELDAVTKKKYPTAEAFAKDLPRILRDLGFTKDKATFLAERIDVDPSRGAGHALGAARRGDHAHLRSRVGPDGMDYKGYNIGIHEFGHNVEQTFSLYSVDFWLLNGVPNTAFTEALAFLFQARDLELLGRPPQGAEHARLRVLDDFWNAFEISGSALVELDVWRWLYEHPDASAAELREATVRIARDTWNKYYAPVLGGEDVSLLGIYSHTVSTPLYLFNYVYGQLIAFQVEEHLAGKDKATFASEFERVATYGRVSPDVWMVHATGAPVDTAPLLDATKRALAR
jgi:hypothetical protein